MDPTLLLLDPQDSIGLFSSCIMLLGPQLPDLRLGVFPSPTHPFAFLLVSSSPSLRPVYIRGPSVSPRRPAQFYAPSTPWPKSLL